MKITIDAPSWKLLRKQKQQLLVMMNDIENRRSDESELLDGLIHLLDHIQDSALAQGLSAREVFGTKS